VFTVRSLSVATYYASVQNGDGNYRLLNDIILLRCFNPCENIYSLPGSEKKDNNNNNNQTKHSGKVV